MTKHFHLLSLVCVCLWLACNPEKDDPSGGCATPPTAAFVPDKTSGNAPLTITFDNNSIGATTYLWEFGGGVSSTAPEPIYTFNTAGTYTVTLTASSGAACKGTATVVITVNSASTVPVAAFTITNGGCVGPCSVVFTNTSTDAVSFQWDFGDGSQVSTLNNPTHTYQAAGNYLVTLTATGAGGTDTEVKPVSIQGQTFKKTFGGVGDDWGFSVQQTTDGGYVLLGYTRSEGAGLDDLYLIKTDNNGNLVWKRTFGGVNNDAGYSVQQTTDGGYVLLGYTSESTSMQDLYLIKTDNNGNLVWKKTFGGANYDLGLSLQQTADGGFVLLGATSSEGAGLSDVFLLKTDNNGNLVWKKTFGGISEDEGHSVQQTADGGYVLLGTTRSEGAGGDDLYLIKTDNTGNLVWKKTFGGAAFDSGFAVHQTTDGGYVLLGYTNSEGAGQSDVYLIKTDNTGNLAWEKTFGGANGDEAYSVQQTADGGYVLLGTTYSEGAGQGDVYLIKTDSNGNLTWKKTFGGANEDSGRFVKSTFDGGYILLGHTSSFGSGGRDLYLIKTDMDGNAQ